MSDTRAPPRAAEPDPGPVPRHGKPSTEARRERSDPVGPELSPKIAAVLRNFRLAD